MPAYIIVDVTIDNAENYEAYKKLTPASVAAYDGKFIVRGGAFNISRPQIFHFIINPFFINNAKSNSFM